jgi:hypothetical protein
MNPVFIDFRPVSGWRLAAAAEGTQAMTGEPSRLVPTHGGNRMAADPTVRTRGAVRTRRDPIETKPFYLTSEFMVLVGMTVALFIASTTLDDVDSRLAWVLGVSLVGAYILSRGIAKSGTRSSSVDPREDMLDRDRPTTAEERDVRSRL